ncbi:flowering time control protein FCA-like isoform X2 [Dendrobium catenatum]|uniref:Flowering time control protein FCA n=1 Tax=Dendrobium catenatum TaxID=906689 RepID=A0A2I0WRQ3_9ASPA|nr:flowering time control protein FCA-like isoform X2 [Dendrobium catenatum]PKU78359.1 Flowering time control protein FCA [Dendrobium catenatum]
MDRHRGDRFGDGGKYSRMPSRWPSDTPPNQHQRFPRGGGISGSGEGFSGGRYHPYRGQPDYSSAGGQGFRDGHGDLGGHQMPMNAQKRGFAGRGGSPDYGEGNKFAKLFVGSVPKTATEEDIRPLFEEHGDVVEVALIKDWRTGQQQGFCFIKYASSEHADRAIRALHNQFTLPGATGPIQVKYADAERERFGPAEDKLFVASLNRRATEKEVEEIFALYGHVEDVYLIKDEMKQSRGCGFVKFSNRDMALAAMNALHGTYVMRGCEQPLIVRFAEPKRPRPFDQRNAPAFGGPGFGPHSDAVILNRQPEKFDEPRGGHVPHKGWPPLSPQSGVLPSQSSTQGLGSQTVGMGGIPPTLPGSFGDGLPPSNGALPNLAPISSSSQSFNPPLAQAPPSIGQQILPLQKSLQLPQNVPPALPLHNALISFSHAQTQALQAPMQQLGQFPLPQSIALNSFSQAQQVPGLSGQLSASSSLTPQNATAAALHNPLGLQQQGLTGVPNQQQLPISSISQHLLQQPGHQLPTQMLLQQQAQTLQSSYQTSQQAIFQIQQQLQMMQQSNISQQQSSQSAKQQSPWSGPPATTTTPASMHGTAIPSTISAAPLHALSAPSGAVTSTCNWTEHTSPEGFKYYYNSVTRESKWEKPEELTVFEQQQQQKLLLLQQQQLLLQQQKISAPQLKSPSETASQMQVQTPVQSVQQVAQTQVQPQIQPRQQTQLQILQPSLVYHQASGAASHQTVQDISNPQLHGAGSGIQVSQEWAWKNKPAGS